MSKRGAILFLSLGLLWGIPYLLIKVSVEYLSPEVIIFLRVFLAATILLPVVVKRGYLRQLKGHWKWVFVFAIVEIAFPFGALTFAEIKLSSSMAGLLIAAVPIVSAIFAWRLGIDDRITGNRVLGLAIGIVGVASLVGLDVTGSELFSVALIAITVVGYALGPIIVSQKLSQAPALAVIAMAMVINSVIYAPFAFISRPTESVPMNVWLSVAVLGAVCTALTFILFFSLVAEVGPARTTVITYINPAVAVILGVLVLSEPITLGLIIGFPLILLGSFLATRKGPAFESEPIG
ncbi:MAG: DMT family transporter [Candidatus Nanopelagicales bacterium]|jgi:drug/metabolite transporter (DMT)-like permease|nr:EamA family transporter [Candidatus Nanopelagicales bacterium]